MGSVCLSVSLSFSLSICLSVSLSLCRLVFACAGGCVIFVCIWRNIVVMPGAHRTASRRSSWSPLPWRLETRRTQMSYFLFDYSHISTLYLLRKVMRALPSDVMRTQYIIFVLLSCFPLALKEDSYRIRFRGKT